MGKKSKNLLYAALLADFMQSDTPPRQWFRRKFQTPHQGAADRARRRRQLRMGMIKQ